MMRELRFSSSPESDADDELQTWRLLSHQIRSNPHNLLAHVQRILLTQDENLQNRTGGTLLDLYLALGTSGVMLRTRMLDICRDQLDEDTVSLFDSWLESGVDEHACGWMSGSMLATGEIPAGSSLLKLQRSTVEPEYIDVLAEVQDHLEYGQVELAQALLETEVLEGRATSELEHELLTVYQHTRNGKRLEEISDKLISSDVKLSEDWQEARVRAKNW